MCVTYVVNVGKTYAPVDKDSCDIRIEEQPLTGFGVSVWGIEKHIWLVG